MCSFVKLKGNAYFNTRSSKMSRHALDHQMAKDIIQISKMYILGTIF